MSDKKSSVSTLLLLGSMLSKKVALDKKSSVSTLLLLGLMFQRKVVLVEEELKWISIHPLSE